MITSTDPFAKTPVKKGTNGKKPRRPHVVITFHPGKRVDQRKGGAKVTFRFHSIGKAARFKCRINKRKLRTCNSPKRYRLPLGNFHFKVYAVGPTGLKGPPAHYRFRVGPILEPGPSATCPPARHRPPAVPAAAAPVRNRRPGLRQLLPGSPASREMSTDQFEAPLGIAGLSTNPRRRIEVL